MRLTFAGRLAVGPGALNSSAEVRLLPGEPHPIEAKEDIRPGATTGLRADIYRTVQRRLDVDSPALPPSWVGRDNTPQRLKEE